MIDNEGEIKQKNIQKRAFLFACRIVNFYRFLANQENVGEIRQQDKAKPILSQNAILLLKKPERHIIGFDSSQKLKLCPSKG